MLSIIVYFCYILGNVDHSVCVTITIFGNGGGGKDYALCLYVDPYIYVSVQDFSFG